MKTLGWLLALFLTSSVQAQVISWYQATNNFPYKTNGTFWASHSWGGTGMKWSGFYHPLFASSLTLTDSNVVKWRYLGSGGFYMTGPVQVDGNFQVLGSATDSAGTTYATTIDSSNDVQVAAGAGINIASAGAGGVQTYTVTATFGSGATNAISSVTTNGALVGVGFTGLGVTNGADTIVSGYSNSGSAFIAWSLDPTVKVNLTNYATSIGTLATGAVMQASSTLATAIGTLGTNATNNDNLVLAQAQAFSYTIGDNATSYVNTAFSANSNLTLAVFLANSNASLNAFLANSNANLTKQDATAVLNNLTNSGLQFPSGNLVSNVGNLSYKVQFQNIPTNSSLSNIVVNVRTNKYWINCTNNPTITNLVGLNSVDGFDTTLIFVPQLINRGVGWPVFGIGTNGYGFKAITNVPMWTTLTANVAYAVSISGFGTNTFWAITEWK